MKPDDIRALLAAMESPGPLTFDAYSEEIRAGDHYAFARDVAPADAAAIVAVMNAAPRLLDDRDRLLKALEASARKLHMALDMGGRFENCIHVDCGCSEARAAIAAVGGRR